MGSQAKKKKGFQMPHVYLVILILMLFVAILTYIVPAGAYARIDGAIDPNTYTRIEQTPVSFIQFFTAIPQGFIESANIIGCVLLISGCIQVINMTGTFSAGIQAMQWCWMRSPCEILRSSRLSGETGTIQRCSAF